MAVMNQGPAIPRQNMLSADNSNLVADFVARGVMEPLPAVEKVLRHGRQEMEAVDEQPFIAEEKQRRKTEIFDNAIATISELISREVQTRRRAFDSEGGKIVAAARRDDLLSPEVARRESIFTDQAAMDRDIASGLPSEELEDFAANALLTDNSAYIRRVLPAIVDRAEALHSAYRKAHPNQVGTLPTEAALFSVGDMWAKWRKSNPTPQQMQRTLHEKRDLVAPGLQRAAQMYARLYGFGQNVSLPVRTE